MMNRAAVTVAGALLLSSCAGSPSLVAPSLMQQVHAASRERFKYTGKEQTFTVPAGVTSVKIVAAGASGPSGTYYYGSYHGGNGGMVTATIPVTPGETLAVFVGGEGGTAKYGTNGTGGFNGGGSGGSGRPNTRSAARAAEARPTCAKAAPVSPTGWSSQAVAVAAASHKHFTAADPAAMLAD